MTHGLIAIASAAAFAPIVAPPNARAPALLPSVPGSWPPLPDHAPTAPPALDDVIPPVLDPIPEPAPAAPPDGAPIVELGSGLGLGPLGSGPPEPEELGGG